MALSIGTKLGPYEIVAPLGAGGMGEVYRARDTRLDRTVAIKVLPSHLAAEPEARERFDREARAISGVSHPNICTLYDVGHQEGIDYLVMEYLEGGTLADRLKQGPLAIDLTLRYAVEIADAMDKAHRLGVVHRDLKPANVILTKTGSKLLDFGLAKLQSGGIASSDYTARPTQRTLTKNGTLIGTIQYMSPEQLEGMDCDARSDIFAFGVILYEMVSGRRPFQAASQASLIGAILHVEPLPLSAVQPLSPPLLDHIVRKCLAKSPQDRWQNARDLVDEIRWISGQDVQSRSTPAPSVPLRVGRLAWSAFSGVLALGLVVLGVAYARSPAPADIRSLRFEINPPQNTVLSPAPADLSVSPDGRHVVFGALNEDGDQLLWLRPLDSMAAHPLAGTENAFSPFWAPDGLQIGFFAQGKMKRIALSGGLPETICDAPDGRGGTWNRDGVIVFARNLRDTLYRVAAVGGTPSAVGALDQSAHEMGHVWPEFLPYGDHYLYLAWSSERDEGRVRIGSLKPGEPKTILKVNSNTSFTAPGYVLFVSNGRLLAQQFDSAKLEATGEAFPVAEDVWTNPATGRAAFAASRVGVLAYRNGVISTTQFVERDRTGKELSRFGNPGGYGNPSLSPDGKRIAVDLRDYQNGTRSIWTFELAASGIMSRVTFGSNDSSPIWMSTGKHILFLSDRDAARDSFNIYRTEVAETTKEDLVFKLPNVRDLLDWSPSENTVIYQTSHAKTKSDIWILKPGDDKPVPFLLTEFNEIHGRLSPNSQWLAYSSDESGRYEIYVQRFPAGGGKRQLSTAGGMQPQWNPNGKELFFLAPDRTLMVLPANPGASFEVDTPKPLFPSGVYAPSVVRSRNNYVVAADGQSFIINTIVDSRKPINVITGWRGR